MTRARRRLLALGLCIACAPASAPADWSVETDRPEDAAEPIGVATVRNEHGERVRVWVDDEGLVRGTLDLAPGLAQFAPGSCPTLRVDEHPPAAIGGPTGTCLAHGRTLRFTFAGIDAGEIRSASLLRLMNGVRLRVRYRLTRLGYAQTEFSLRGSNRSIDAALGPGVIVMEEP